VAIDVPPETYYREIFSSLLESRELEDLAREIRAGRRAIVISGLAGSARALVLAAIEKKTARRLVFVARSGREVEEIQSDIEFFYCALNGVSAIESRVLTIPAIETDPYDGTSPHAEVLEQRALALHRATSGEARILLTSLNALAARTLPPGLLSASSLALRVNEEMPPELIVDLLIASGYVRQEPVGAVGEFSLRGGILDVFSPAHEAPHRIEFFGDTVDSIREFDADTQRSVGRAAETVIVPMREMAVRREEFMAWGEAAERHWADERFRRDLRARLAHAERGEPFPGWEYLLPLTRPLTASAFDYMKDAVLVMDEPAEIEKRAAELYGYLADRYAQADDAGELALPPERLFLTADELRAKFDAMSRVELRLLGRDAAATDEQFRIDALTITKVPDIIDEQASLATDAERDEQATAAQKLAESFAASRKRAGNLFLFTINDATPDISIISQSPRRYYGRVNELARDLAMETESRRTTLFVMPSLGLAERVAEILRDYEVTAELLPSLNINEREANATLATGLVATVGKLANGFALPTASLNLLTESDVFGDADRAPAQRTAPKRARKQRKASAFLSDLGDLKVGDYVVHVDHGIGQFQGLLQMTTAGAATGNVAAGLERASTGVREFMLLTFAEGARLYVPVERLDLVQRYSGGEGHQPNLDRLGGDARYG
jgi:transcription-repair coupling factor (superfamily II helicase)